MSFVPLALDFSSTALPNLDVGAPIRLAVDSGWMTK